jgi:hypothetical protein
VSSPLGIVELGDVCGRMRARNLDLFERLGTWVATTTDAALQQLLATTAHRHAWHAELWRGRAPAIPPVDLESLTGAHRAALSDLDDLDGLDDNDRIGWYRAQLDGLQGELAELKARVDDVLDASTHRTAQLVIADLDDLSDRLAHH